MILKTKLVLLLTCLMISSFSGCASSQRTEKSKTTPKATPVTTTGNETPMIPTAVEIRCLSGKDERIISIQPVGQGCQVVYTRHTEISPIANSTKSMEYCNDVAQKMKLNLEASRFKCQSR
jgi:hypothetical protein